MVQGRPDLVADVREQTILLESLVIQFALHGFEMLTLATYLELQGALQTCLPGEILHHQDSPDHAVIRAAQGPDRHPVMAFRWPRADDQFGPDLFGIPGGTAYRGRQVGGERSVDLVGSVAGLECEQTACRSVEEPPVAGHIVKRKGHVHGIQHLLEPGRKGAGFRKHGVAFRWTFSGRSGPEPLSERAAQSEAQSAGQTDSTGEASRHPERVHGRPSLGRRGNLFRGDASTIHLPLRQILVGVRALRRGELLR